MSVHDLYLDFKPKPPARARRFRMVWTDRIRHAVQFGFVAFILYMSVAHHTAVEDGTTASIDALCPFGGLATLWRYISTGGQYVQDTPFQPGARTRFVDRCAVRGRSVLRLGLSVRRDARRAHVVARQTLHSRDSSPRASGSRLALRALSCSRWFWRRRSHSSNCGLPIGILIERCSVSAGCLSSILPNCGSRTPSPGW